MAAETFISRVGRRFKSKPQLSLLSLLIVISIVAVLVQFCVVPALRQRAREATLERISGAGGQWAEISTKPLQRRLLLSGQKADDELLIEIATQARSLPELVQLDLFQTLVTDKGWDAVTSYNNQLKHMVIFENKITEKAIEATERRRKDLKIERRVPDPVAIGLAMAPIPPAALISLISVGPRILAGAGDGRLHVLDADIQRPRRVIKMHENWLFDIALSPQGDLLASAGGDNQLAIWSYPELELVTRIAAHDGDLHGVVWLDNSHLATVSDDRSLRSWTLERAVDADGKLTSKLSKQQSLIQHEKAIPRIRMSSDGRTLITASRDDRMIVWKVDQNFAIQQATVLEGHTDDCMDVQIDPSGKLAISVGYDGAMLAWDLQTSTLLKRHQLSEDRLFCLEVNWERGLAYAGTPRGVVEYDLATNELKSIDDQPFVSRVLSSSNTIFTSDGLGSLIARRSRDLSPFMKATLFEVQYDHYSHDFFKRISPSDAASIASVRLIRNQ